MNVLNCRGKLVHRARATSKELGRG